ncbi:MAG TPA: anthranilate synthase component I, partial [Spirochaetia bacterium]|nr:anthranilate synthase component I [Spirochaetia bacterium]
MAVATQKEKVLIRVINGERFTPLSLAKKLEARALLESASFHRGKERYSFLLVREAFRVFQKGDDFFMARDGATLALKTKARDILDVLAHFSGQHAGLSTPFPLPTGGIGFLSYEYCARFDTIRLREKADPLGVPDA